MIFRRATKLLVIVIIVIIALGAFGKLPNPGTVLIARPDASPCRTVLGGSAAQSVSVKWFWRMKDFGWGCVIQNRDGTTSYVVPMPEAHAIG